MPESTGKARSPLPVDARFERIEMPDADVNFLRCLELGQPEPQVLERLVAETAWRAESVVMWGRKLPQPRLTAWYGDPGRRYAYSGIELDPLPWTTLLRDIKARVENAVGTAFNSVLLNHYRDHSDSIGFHSDDEPELGARPVIASLSLGQERIFVLRHKKRKDVQPVRLRLTSGSLLVMGGDTQHAWRHGIPKEAQPRGPRINLTFRTIVG